MGPDIADVLNREIEFYEATAQITKLAGADLSEEERSSLAAHANDTLEMLKSALANNLVYAELERDLRERRHLVPRQVFIDIMQLLEVTRAKLDAERNFELRRGALDNDLLGAALQKQFGLSASQAVLARPGIEEAIRKAASVEDAPKIAQQAPDVAPELYADRKAGEDAISFYHRVWDKFSGAVFLSDLERLDPDLVPAIRSRCSYMARKHPERSADYAARNYLPPTRSSLPVDDRLAQKREDARLRQARYINKLRGVDPS